MRRLGILLIFVLFVCFARTSEARKLALLVGVDEYSYVPSLRCCVNDMNTLKEALKKIGFKESDIKVLTTGSNSIQKLPVKQNIEQNIDEILSSTGPSDMVLLAFSGHGMREDETDYFCPPYADPKNLKETCVSITKVMNDLARCKARLKWMVVDACRNESENSRDARAFQVIPAAPAGIVLFQSCAKGQKSYEEERKGGNGYFTKNFAAALSGEADSNHDGKLTLLEVCEWTTAKTEAEVEKAENKLQRPYLKGELSKFVLIENMDVPKAKALAKKAHKKIEKGEYEEAIRLLDEAIQLCNSFDSWKRERKNAQKLLEAEKRIKKAEQKARQAVKMQSRPTPAVTPAKPTSSGLNSSGNAHSEPSPQAGIIKVLKADEMVYSFRWCPPGEFMMGGDSRLNDSKPVHKVRLTEGFWLLETEVTQEMWESVMGYSKNPSKFKGEKKPVENVSWYDCQEFCQKLSKKLGQKVYLPTEAQWEYACRAGTKGDYIGDLASMAWYDESMNTGSTHPVAQKRANAWGLYDMHGNVGEWCSDYYSEKFYSVSPTDDPENTVPSPNHVVRGGNWLISAGGCTSARRDWGGIDRKDERVGFRILLRPSSWD